MSFDGSNDYVALPENNPIWLPQYDFSLSFWVYFARDHFYDSLAEVILDLNFGSSSVATNELGYIIHRLRGSGKLYFQMVTTTNPDDDLYSNEVLVKDTWNHIVAVRDGVTQSIYINGLLDANTTCSEGPICFEGGYDDDRVNIGRYTADMGKPPRSYFKGKIDDFMIFDISLSAAEIQYLFQKIN